MRSYAPNSLIDIYISDFDTVYLYYTYWYIRIYGGSGGTIELRENLLFALFFI